MPDWETEIRKLLAGLNLPPTREAEITEELAAHARDRYAELQTGGVAAPEAVRIVRDELSGHELLAQELHEVERINVPEPVALGGRGPAGLLAGLRHDLIYGFRTLRKSPGFTAVALLALAIGIGANTAIFSVVNGVLLRPLPYPDPARLVMIFETTPQFSQASDSYPDYLDWRRDSHAFVDMAAARNDDFNFTGAGEPEHLSGEYVTASFFHTLGVRPMLGRAFLPADDQRGAPCTAILTYGFWKTRMNAARDILGKSMTLNAARCTVIGVLGQDFQFREKVQVYVPIEQWISIELNNREVHPGLGVVGRLKPGVTMRAAQDELSSIAAVLAKQYPVADAGRGTKLVPIKEDVVGAIRPTLLLLTGAVGFVLIIACANVANLLLARSTSRKREFAIRAALGAARARIVRQLLTESVLLSLGGAALGLLLARWGTGLVLAASPGSLPRSSEIGIDWNVLLFTLAVSVLTGIVFGLSPAWFGANADPQESLQEGRHGAGGARHRVEGAFVALEVGMAVVLLAGAGLMIQSIWRLLRVEPGFNTHNVLTTEVAVSPQAMASGPGIRVAYQQMLTRVGAIPGVQAAALTSLLPLSDNDNEIGWWPGAGPQPSGDRISTAMCYVVSADYLQAMQIPLQRGRFLTNHDDLAAPHVVVIDELLARHNFPNQDPIGKQISLSEVGTVRIVGIAGHVKHWGLDSDDTAKVRDQLYFPFLQIPDNLMAGAAAGVTMVIRTTPEPLSLLPEVRAQVAGPTEDQPVYDAQTYEQIISGSLAERRFTMLLLIIFAATALLLAAVGIYGVMSYTVGRRAHELGIRVALGATRQEIAGLVLRQGIKLAGIGLLAGLAAALGLTRLLASMLYGVHPADPVTLAAVAVVLGVIALLACYLPARRAASVDPIIALRWE